MAVPAHRVIITLYYGLPSSRPDNPPDSPAVKTPDLHGIPEYFMRVRIVVSQPAPGVMPLSV